LRLRGNEVRSARDERIQHITTSLAVSVIGCVVNGPGDARETDIGLAGGGNGTHQIYLGGLTDHRLTDADIVELVEKKPPKSKPQNCAKKKQPSPRCNSADRQLHAP